MIAALKRPPIKVGDTFDRVKLVDMRGSAPADRSSVFRVLG
jgi:hypothetical protein